MPIRSHILMALIGSTIAALRTSSKIEEASATQQQGPGSLELPAAHAWDIDRALQLARQRSSSSSPRSLQGHQDNVMDIKQVVTDKYQMLDPTYLQPGDPPAVPGGLGEGLGSEVQRQQDGEGDEASGVDSGTAAKRNLGGDGSEGDAAAAASPADDRSRSRAAGGRARQRQQQRLSGCALSAVPEACRAFASQLPQPPAGPAPRGNATCVGGCGLVGNCHHDLGLCMCPAGWTGPHCEQPLKRPCTHRVRGVADPIGVILSHIDPVTKHDLNWSAPGWTASRCAGYCDDDVAMCYCGHGSVHAHVPAPAGSPPGTPALRAGRPMADSCKPDHGADGAVAGANVAGTSSGLPWAALYDRTNGWCSSGVDVEPAHRCECSPEGLTGNLCELRAEVFCPGQCSGRGECRSGFCKCHDGWYGTDCSRKAAGLPIEPPSLFTTRPWLSQAVRMPTSALPYGSTAVWKYDNASQGSHGRAGERAKNGQRASAVGKTAEEDRAAALGSIWRQDGPALLRRREAGDGGGGRGATRGGVPPRRRPYIYVYDLPPEYNARMLQYKIQTHACSWRWFRGREHNSSDFNSQDNGYSIETFLHEAMLASSQRTFDPEAANFFYVPVYVTCLMWPVLGWADFPFYYAPDIDLRPMHVANMLLEVKRWLQKTMPWWDRRGGRDHIWLMPHDEGACYMPSEIYNSSIVLTHWGRLDLQHKSGSAYWADNYSKPLTWPGYQAADWRELYKGHACFTPGKDLVIPLFKEPRHFSASPLLGAAPLVRDVLLYFRGDVGLHREACYSRGIRQLYYRLAHEQGWRKKYKIFIGSGEAQYKGDYSEHLARSKFCLAVPGDGYSARYVDAILHGCIPVVVMDNVTEAFESLLDWRQFSVRIKESDIEHTPQILQAIGEPLILQMQRSIAKVWQRFAWTDSVLHRSKMPEIYQDNQKKNRERWGGAPELPSDHHFRPRERYPVNEDAFSTLMQWLHGRIKHTR